MRRMNTPFQRSASNSCFCCFWLLSEEGGQESKPRPIAEFLRMPALRCFDHLHFLYNQNVSFQKKKFLWCNCCWGEVLSNVLRITSTEVHQLVRFFIRSRLMFYLCCKFGGCGVSSVCVHVSWSKICNSLRRPQDFAQMELRCEPDLRGFALELRT